MNLLSVRLVSLSPSEVFCQNDYFIFFLMPGDGNSLELRDFFVLGFAISSKLSSICKGLSDLHGAHVCVWWRGRAPEWSGSRAIHPRGR